MESSLLLAGNGLANSPIESENSLSVYSKQYSSQCRYAPSTTTYRTTGQLPIVLLLPTTPVLHFTSPRPSPGAYSGVRRVQDRREQRAQFTLGRAKPFICDRQ